MPSRPLERCSLDPDLCRVVAVGWWREREPKSTTATLATMDGATLLSTVWHHVEQGHLVGFNCSRSTSLCRCGSQSISG